MSKPAFLTVEKEVKVIKFRGDSSRMNGTVEVRGIVNKDGTISFLEFVQGLNSLSAGADNEDKLRFAFQIYDINNDGFISNGELFTVLKMMVGTNLNDVQL